MIQYTIDNINAVEKYNRYVLADEIKSILDHYTKMVTSPTYSKTPHFLIKKSLVLDNNRSKITTLQDSIKKVLNKITERNFEKLVCDLVVAFNTLLKEVVIINNEDKTDYIGDTIKIIFNNFFVSKMNIEVNIDILYRLITESSKIQLYLNQFVESISDLYNMLETCKTICFEEMDRVGKINTVIKNKIIFLCRLEKRGKISRKIVDDYIIRYQTYLLSLLNEEHKKMECEEVAELILTFLSEVFATDKSEVFATDKSEVFATDKSEVFATIKANIHAIINGDVSTMKSLSNKIVLKHKNLLDKIKVFEK
jgi:hypothetical protein